MSDPINPFHEAFTKALKGEAQDPPKQDPAKPAGDVQVKAQDVPLKDPDVQVKAPDVQVTPKTEAKEETKETEAQKAERVRDEKGKFLPDESGPKALREELKRLKQELEEARKAPVQTNPEEIEQLRRERDELDSLVKRVRYQDSKEFKDKFERPLKRLVEKALEYAPSGEVRDRLETILSRPQSNGRVDQLEAILQDVPALRQGTIARYSDEISDLMAERDDALAQAGERLKLSQAEEAKRRESEFAKQHQHFEGLFENTLKEAQAEVFFFKEKDGDSEHNDAVRGRIALAKELLTGNMDPGDVIRSAFYSAAFPDTFKELARARQAIESLSKELDGFRGNRPTPPAGGGASETKPKGFKEVFKEALSS